MSKEKILECLFSLVEWKPLKLVEFAESGHGFGGDDGAYRVEYKKVENETLSEISTMVEVSCWTCGDNVVLITKEEYLNALKKYLLSKGEVKLKERIDTIS